MTYDSYLAIAAFLLSLIVAISGFRKGKSEVRNIDADTYLKYQQSLEDSHNNYLAVSKELEEMRQKMHQNEEVYEKEIDNLKCKIDNLEQSYEKLEIHNKALIEQLIDKDITPIDAEEAYKKAKTKRRKNV